METVRIAVVGDAGVGKSSLALAASNQTFRGDPTVTAVPPVRIRVNAQGTECMCECLDTDSAVPEHVQSATKVADVVMVCYAMNDDVTLRNACERWLPVARRSNRSAPIVLMGCKEDASTMTSEGLAVRQHFEVHRSGSSIPASPDLRSAVVASAVSLPGAAGRKAGSIGSRRRFV